MEYNVQSVVLASDCDNQTKLSVLGAVKIAEDSSCNFLHLLNADGVRMKSEFNALWVYTKNHTKFFKPLMWNEQFTIKCFVSTKTPVRMVVDTALLNSNVEVAVYSRVELCMIDATTYRLRCIDDNMLNQKIECQQCLCNCDFEKLNFEKPNTALDSVVIRSTNIDYCNHTNNVEYIRFLLNTYTTEQLLNRPIKELQINYLSQVLEGEKLDIFKQTIQNADCFEMSVDNKASVKCKFVF